MPDRKWLILASVMLFFFFLNLSVFNTLGVALHAMIQDLGWSYTEAGFSYTVLGVACGFGSLLPVFLLKRIGARWCMTIGGAMLTAGFVLGAVMQHIATFYAAMGIAGAGFALAANVPGVWIISAWFEETAPRYIGFFLMVGALGSIVGPNMVQTIITFSDWRTHWALMAIACAALTLLVCVIVREFISPDLQPLEGGDTPEPPAEEWTAWAGVGTLAFGIIALAFNLNLASSVTVAAIAVSHLEQLGASVDMAALGLGLVSLVATLIKGVSGRLCERYSSRLVMAAGTGLMGLGSLLFTVADSTPMILTFAVVFGAGWGLNLVGSTVLLLDYFGRAAGSELLSLAYMFSTLASAGPLIAGWTADEWGTFSPLFYACGAALILTVIPILLMRPPQRRDESAPNRRRFFRPRAAKLPNI